MEVNEEGCKKLVQDVLNLPKYFSTYLFGKVQNQAKLSKFDAIDDLQWEQRMKNLLYGLLVILSGTVSSHAADLPNFVVIFIDDMGYADIGPFGAKGYKTPHLDRMAAEGMRFTDFQVSSAVCSASRSALVTGCYHSRIGIHGALGPSAKHGLHEEFLEILNN